MTQRARIPLATQARRLADTMNVNQTIGAVTTVLLYAPLYITDRTLLEPVSMFTADQYGTLAERVKIWKALIKVARAAQQPVEAKLNSLLMFPELFHAWLVQQENLPAFGVLDMYLSTELGLIVTVGPTVSTRSMVAHIPDVRAKAPAWVGLFKSYRANAAAHDKENALRCLHQAVYMTQEGRVLSSS